MSTVARHFVTSTWSAEQAVHGLHSTGFNAFTHVPSGQSRQTVFEVGVQLRIRLCLVVASHTAQGVHLSSPGWSAKSVPAVQLSHTLEEELSRSAVPAAQGAHVAAVALLPALHSLHSACP